MSSPAGPILTAVITGDHNFEVPEFTHLFRALPGVDFYPQSLENFAADLAHVRETYDVLVFYNMHAAPPTEQARAALEALGQVEQGLFFLHHGILAFRKWPPMAEILGLPDRNFTYSPGERVRVEIADPDHPVTKGLHAWEMTDETYLMPDAGPGSHVLLTTDHPKSLKTLAWTRQWNKSRVFALASGHGKETYADPSFQTVLLRGIQWAAGRI